VGTDPHTGKGNKAKIFLKKQKIVKKKKPIGGGQNVHSAEQVCKRGPAATKGHRQAISEKQKKKRKKREKNFLLEKEGASWRKNVPDRGKKKTRLSQKKSWGRAKILGEREMRQGTRRAFKEKQVRPARGRKFVYRKGLKEERAFS